MLKLAARSDAKTLPKTQTNLEKFVVFIKSYSLIFIILFVWQFASSTGLMPKYKLPAPTDVIMAFIGDFDLIMQHSAYTLKEALIGLSLGVLIAFVLSIIMDANRFVRDSIYPVLVVSQTIPSVAMAPLLVLWLGYGILPKVVLIILTTFFPIVIALLDAYASVENEHLMLFQSMGANRFQTFWHLKLPSAWVGFFSGLKISVSYSIIGAVVAEWLGGFHGLGVYMTRVRKSYAFDKMFAVIFFISFLSLIAIWVLSLLEKKVIKWQE